MKHLLSRTSSLSIKLPMMMICGGLLAAGAVGINSHFQAQAEMSAADEARQRALTISRGKFAEQIGQNFFVDINLMQTAPTIREAYEFIAGVYGNGNKAVTEEIHKHYTGRAVAAGKARHDYNGEDDKSTYAIAHKRWHSTLKQFAKDKGYYDLFLISPAGDVIYTVEKEPDFATNLRTGPWRNTGLARAFENALAKPDKPTFEDFENYAPSNGDPAAFLAKAMRDDHGNMLGVVAIQLPTDVITVAIAGNTGMKSGLSYLVGSDGRLRTETDRGEKKSVFSQTPLAELIKQTGSSASNTYSIGPGIDGKLSTLSLSPVKFMERSWYMVTDVSTSAQDEVVHRLAMKNGLVALVVLLCLSIFSFFSSRRITKPLNQMRDAVGRLATGENSDIPGESRSDELGDLARSLRQVHEAGVAAAQIRSGLDKRKRQRHDRKHRGQGHLLQQGDGAVLRRPFRELQDSLPDVLGRSDDRRYSRSVPQACRLEDQKDRVGKDSHQRSDDPSECQSDSRQGWPGDRNDHGMAQCDG